MEKIFINQATKKNIIFLSFGLILSLFTSLILAFFIFAGYLNENIRDNIIYLIFFTLVIFFCCYLMRNLLELKQIIVDCENEVIIIKQIILKKNEKISFTSISEFRFLTEKEFIADTGEHTVLRLEIFDTRKQRIAVLYLDYFPDTSLLEKKIKITSN